jgi:methylmalonyl-CoA/ethylmalonyl-CoA epimerase
MTQPERNDDTGGIRATSGNAMFHHVGYAVQSIAAIGEEFAKSLGSVWNGEIIHDPLQEAKVAFIFPSAGQAPSIELLEPAGGTSPLHKFLLKGGGLHHVCYEVDCLESQLQQSRSVGCLIVKKPLPAVAFDGRKIAWIYTPQKLLVEYLER